MIIQIRGTSGSGKTTVVRRFMEKLLTLQEGNATFQPKYETGRGKPIWYEYQHKFNRVVYVLGHYEPETPCGGCDTIGSAPEIVNVINRCHKYYEEYRPHAFRVAQPILITEGLLWSEDTKWTKHMLDGGRDVRSIFLTTPLDQCIKQIKSRRKAAGNEKELNTENTTKRFDVIERARLKLEPLMLTRRMGVDQAVKTLLKWITER